MAMYRFLIFLSMSILFAGTGRAGDLAFASGRNRTNLLELYTSEGCSSCPPAEAWLSKLKNDPGLWRDFVPVAFHVDYWDRLGWRDPFAAKAWTARQYQYSARWKSSSVYTPGFVLNGREWRNSSLPGPSSETPGTLKLIVHENDGVSATFAPATADSRKYELHLARLGTELKIDVKAGENSGRKLQHDFVVLGLTSNGLAAGAAEMRLPAAEKQTAEARNAVAAWITEAGQIEPIQAVGGWLR